MADIEFGDFDHSQGQLGGHLPLLNWAGAALSVGLIAGLAIWGYKLTVRNVAGVPVVRAIEGPMRILPEDPGGQLAKHQGLAVNQVQAVGAAEAAAERLILAPEPIALIDSDKPIAAAPLPSVQTVKPDAESVVPAVAPPAPIVADIVQEDAPDTIDQLIQQVALNVSQSASQPAKSSSAAVEVEEAATVDVLPASVPGLKKSLRPTPRPAAELLAAEKAKVALRPATSAVSEEVDVSAIPAGTRLVQLGAFDSAEIARSEWTRIEAQFPQYFNGKTRVVQRAESGGRVFYRLRAIGFADLSDARRFCSVLLAEETACIPVVVR